MEIVIIFHQAKVRVGQNICIAVERRELSGYEHMKSGDGSKIKSFIKNLFPIFSIYTITNEQRMSLMAVIYQLATFSASDLLFPMLYALTRLIV